MRRISLILAFAVLALVSEAATAAALAAAAPPPVPRIEQVYFTNAENVLIDHTKPASLEKLKKGEQPPEKAKEVTTINELPNGLPAAQWQSPRGLMTRKTWPLAFPRERIMKIAKTRIALEPEAEEFIETKLEGAITLIGETTVGTTAITFEQKIPEAEAKAQAAERKGYLEAKEEAKASVALPNEVNSQAMKIKWKWKLKPKGEAAFEQGAGESTHNLYLTYNAAQPGMNGVKIYFTLLARDTELVKKIVKLEKKSQVVSAVWEAFSNGKEPVGMPIWTYVPTTGVVTKTAENMLYYENMGLGKNLTEVIAEEEKAFARGKRTLAALLENLDGECGAWQEALNKALKAEGIRSQNVKLEPVAGVEGFLVKNWNLPEPGEVGFPNKAEKITKQEGVHGQGTVRPSSFFQNHQVLEIENTLYDPSYGLPPLEKPNEGPLGEGAEAKEIQEKYQAQALAGFCNEGIEEWECRRTPKGLELKFGAQVEVE